MIGDLFDSPWKILIVAVVIIVLFGSKKLPGAARSLGQSMRILKREVSDLHHDEEPDSAPKDGAAQFPPAQLTAGPGRTARGAAEPDRRAAAADPRPPAGRDHGRRPGQRQRVGRTPAHPAQLG